MALRLATRRRLREMDRRYQEPIKLQGEQLKWLLETAANTEYGKLYDFAGIDSFETYRKRVPICEYEDFRPYIERAIHGENNIFWPEQIKWYAKSSGTTETRSKYIPVSPASLKYSHLQGPRDSVFMAINCFPDHKIFSGKTLALGGSHAISHENAFVRTGDLSAIMIANAPEWTNRAKVPPPEIMLMPDFEKKMDAICRTTVYEDVRCFAGVPSWFLTLMQRMLEYTGCDDITDVWPNLQLFIHGGVGFDSYRSVYNDLIPNPKMHYLETYNASEGFFAIQSDAEDNSMLLMLDYKTYYEFIPQSEWDKKDPKTITLDEVELGEDYAIVISNSSGLWRYKIGDTVTFTSLDPYKIKITGRTKLYINVFGEELMIDDANKAIAAAASNCNCDVFDYTAAPIFMGKNRSGAHEWIVEFIKEPDYIDLFAESLDNELRKVNSDYDAKRKSSLSMLKLHVAPAGFFNTWLKNEGKFGGQHKVPRLNNDRTLMDSLLKRL